MTRSSRDQTICRKKSTDDHRESFWLAFGRGVLRRTYIHAHPRLFVAIATGVMLYWLVAGWRGPISGFLVAFDGGALTFLTAVWFMMAQATEDDVRRRAEIEDEGKYTVLGFGAAAAAAVLLAIVFELNATKTVQSPAPHIALAAATILLSWFFMNTIFALHYAHGYYGDADPSDEYKPIGGLDFPGQLQPDYWDFMYFAFCIGMTFQVSDVEIESPHLRRIVLAHSVMSFFFNVAVLALTVNIVAQLI
jgi:uncharacterized membrane protein